MSVTNQIKELERLKEELLAKQAELELLNKQNDQIKYDGYLKQAEQWAFCVTPALFALHAVEGSIPVEMFTHAMDKANNTIKVLDSMKELQEELINE
ncbi:hypothetical protein [Vibrio diazotrophicus]|uniref:hypothetical protein n=1 Tax=Vibrio diazotrophicus TaxID=685 RepID=UPI000C9E59BE|nr:hypothetical protein [Vibrio diazotrophicus]PNH81351.1 hypothetical protein C1N27_07345 [Vibrio diazotrophicus]